jgi:hypothetical protein
MAVQFVRERPWEGSVSSRISVVGVCLLLAACDSPLGPDTSFRLVGYGGLGALRIVEPTVMVFRAPTEWNEFVRQVDLRAPSGRPEDPIPTVGFPSEMAVALALGGRPSSAYRIRIDRVAREQSRLRVHAIEEIGCVGLAVITYPLAVIAVPTISSPVEAIWSKENLPCQ